MKPPKVYEDTMALVTDGILTQKLPWGLVLIGVWLTIAIELMGLQSLPIAVGVYLPISTSASMFAGGVVRWLVERRMRGSERSIAEVESGPGVLFSSGLIAGGALAGIAIAGIAAALVGKADAAGVPAADYLAHVTGVQQMLGGFATSDLAAILVFAGMTNALRSHQPGDSVQIVIRRGTQSTTVKARLGTRGG